MFTSLPPRAPGTYEKLTQLFLFTEYLFPYYSRFSVLMSQHLLVPFKAPGESRSYCSIFFSFVRQASNSLVFSEEVS